MSRLVIFDGNAILHRAYHAMPPLNSLDGQQINAVYGLVSMLFRVISELKPSHIAFAFDRAEPTFRKKMLQSYQAQRPKMDDDLSSQFALSRKVIKTLGIPVYDKAGFEADDVIGTIAKASTEGVVIVTGDRDILQLVNDKIKLFMPAKGFSEGLLYGEKETKDRMGVGPTQIVDFKALVGDPSDNYKGVPGIGPKTAIKLIEEYGVLDNIYKNLDKLTGRTKTLLQTNKDSAYVSRKLAEIVCDVEVSFEFDDMKKWQVDSDKVLDLFSEIGFRTLTNRAKTLGEQITKENQMTLI